jgi:hypothetical protein
MLSFGARMSILPVGKSVTHRTRGSGIVTGHTEETISIRFHKQRGFDDRTEGESTFMRGGRFRATRSCT